MTFFNSNIIYIDDELGDNSPDEFETHLDTKEVPIEDDAKQDDKRKYQVYYVT